MIKANDTLFQFYLVMMDSFEDFLSEKYPKSNSIEDTKHYQTIIIRKIVQMFHSLESLTKDTLDEVSTRCILRGILDSVAAYSFVYQRENEIDMLFRHYLYALDGWRVYKKSVITISEDNDHNKHKEDYACDLVINQIEEKLRNHTYYYKDTTTTESLIQNANWKYESIQNPRSLRYGEMYSLIGFNDISIEYFRGFLSQFVHGLCLSNRPIADSEQMKKISYESIPIADRFIQAIYHTFHDKEMLVHFISSDNIHRFMNSKDFNYDCLIDFAQALVRKDNTILV